MLLAIWMQVQYLIMKPIYRFLPIFFVVLAYFTNVTVTKGQSPFEVRASVGYTFNPNDFSLGQEETSKIYGMVGQGGAIVNIPVYRQYGIQTGLLGELTYARGEVGISRFNTRTIKFYAPLLITRPVSKQTALMAGMAMKNNKKMKLFHIAGSYNFRYDFVVQLEHRMNRQWSLLATFNHNIILPSAYFVNDPQTSFLLGVSYQLFSASDQPEMPAQKTLKMKR